MYEQYFHLREAPFTIAPDPRYLYLSEQHREALAHLLYGVMGDGGFVLLTGEVGTGKTTICRGLLEQLPDECDVALILNPRLTVVELLSTICDEFRIRCPKGNRSIKVFVDSLNAYLLESHSRGRKAVLIIDEAQNLTASVLEQMRLLTNLETNRRKLLQIILVGQPELRDMLERPDLRQLAQRIVARYHLGPLNREDTGAYVHHRLAVAGAVETIFPTSILGALHRLSGGIPRLINVIADRALLGTYAEGEASVNRKILEKAAVEVLGEPKGILTRLSRPWTVLALAACAALLVILGSLLILRSPTEVSTEQASSSATEAPPPNPHPLRRPVPARSGSALPPQVAPSTETGGGKQDRDERSALSRLEWASERAPAHSESLAFQALFDLWGLSSPSAQDTHPCDHAERSGIHCLSARSGLQDLIRLNHPAVLRLQDANGTVFHGVLTAVDDQTGTLVLGTESRTVSLHEIEQRWSGELTLFWRAPPRYEGSLQLGDRSPVVEWLRKNLAKAEGRTDGSSEDLRLFDPPFQETVKRFQTARGLKPDGIVGPLTIIRLNAEIQSGDDPCLTQLRKDG